MLDQNLKERMILFFEDCSSLYGKQIKIRQYISVNGNNFDRHFTTTSILEFEFKHFGLASSGARVIFSGEIQEYQILSDHLVTFSELEKNEYEFNEKLSEKVFRKSTIKFD